MNILVLGCPGSGTTMVEAMLGAHPHVAMLDEDQTMSCRRIIGKPHVGTKLCVPNQIQLVRRFRVVGKKEVKLPIGSALVSAFRRMGFGGTFPQCPFSIMDLILNDDWKIVWVYRDKEATVDSIVKRKNKGIPRWGGREHAYWMYRQAEETARALRKYLSAEGGGMFHIHYEEVIATPHAEMMDLCGWLGIVNESDVMVANGNAHNWRYPQ